MVEPLPYMSSCAHGAGSGDAAVKRATGPITLRPSSCDAPCEGGELQIAARQTSGCRGRAARGLSAVGLFARDHWQVGGFVSGGRV